MFISKCKCFILVILFIISYNNVSALTNQERGKILDRFTAKQYDLIFESDLINFSSDYSDVFSISKQLDVYNSIASDIEKEKEDVQSKKADVLKTIMSLEESIGLLDKDIEETMRKISQINTDVIKIKSEIDVNSKTIDDLRKKIEENTEILLEYLVYTYKKSNTAYNGAEIDNIKSILLNGESIGDLINDLYFKGIIQVTGKKLIDNHRKYIGELYLNKVSLEKQELDLKELRKQGILEQKILQDKKKFKEEILKASKGKQSYYDVFLEQKLKQENDIRLKTIKEQIKVNATRNQILSKYGCEYVDVSKNTTEARLLELKNPKCYSINKIIISEKELINSGNEGGKVPVGNALDWPVNPIQGLTAYYKDKEYEKIFGAQHNAIDIKVPQGTFIEAPMDGYVIYMNKPTSQDYSYLALKHYDGYVTVYGHLSEILVDDFQFVKKGEVIAKTGGEYGTNGAGFITTGPHLHFEVFRDREYIDPLSVLDLTYIKYQQLPDKYEVKYALDFKNKNGYDFTELKSNSRVFVLKGDNEIERQKYLIKNYASGVFNDWQLWIDESLDGAVDPSFVMCIGLAESGLGRSLTSAYNVGNVGNNDRGDRKDYNNAREGISAIVWTLNNKYFKNYSNMGYLSGGGRLELGLPACGETPTEYCYASSMDHWHNNMKRCLTHLKGVYIEDNYNFRFK